MLKAEGHYAGDLVSLEFKSESLQQFLENVVQIVNQHSRRINTLEIDKLSKEDIRKAHSDFATAAKLSPTVSKELHLESLPKINSLDESASEVCANLTAHSAGSLQLTKLCSICSRAAKK